MAKRYELSDAQWEHIEDMLPGKVGDRGRSARDNRLFVNGVLWVLRSGARWEDMPERYGNGKPRTSASPAGPRPAYGSGCLIRSPPIPTTNI